MEKPVHQMQMPSDRIKSRNLTEQRWSIVLLVFNFIGAVIYVYAASHGWVLRRERGLHSVTGEPYVWALYVFPICVVFFALNLSWGAFIIARRQWGTGILWLSAIPIWLIAVTIDFAHTEHHW